MTTKAVNGAPNGASQSTSDLARLWQQAIEDYESKTKNSLRLATGSSIEDIMKRTDTETRKFNAFRHDNGQADRVRMAFKNNLGLIQTLVNTVQIVGSAASAFPPAMPATLIFNAFGQVTQSFNNVSADYDKVMGFFEFTRRFLDRLSMIEQQTPKHAPFHRCIVRVFSSMLTICAVAQDMAKEKRFKKWFITLIEGTDPALADAYNTMQEAVNELSQAVGLATLRSVEVIAEIQQTIDENLKFVVTQVTTINDGVNVAVSNTNILIKQGETSDLKQDQLLLAVEAVRKETADAVKRMAGARELTRENRARALEMDTKRYPGQKKGKKDPGENRRVALEQIDRYFTITYDGWSDVHKKTRFQRREIQEALVGNTGTWLLHDENKYREWADGKTPILYMTGAAGIGKSFLAQTVITDLESSPKERRSFAYFFFREEEDSLRHFKDALYSLAFQLAEMDPKYSEQVANEISSGNESRSTEPWKRLFAERFPGDKDGHAYIILDGIDEMKEVDRKDMIQCVDVIAKEKLNIHVLLSGRPLELDPLVPVVLEVTKEKLAMDIQKKILRDLKTFPRLRKFRKSVKNLIWRKIKSKADGMRYVDHMLRRLSYIGREKAVLKDLEKKLPNSLDELYNLMLSECQANRTEEQYRTLKKLFAWLAYSKRPLSLGEAAELVELTVDDKMTFDIEDELIGRSARILELAKTFDEDDEDDTDERSDASEQSKDDAETDLQDSGNIALSFQERSLREYFQVVEVDENGLRTPPSIAHLTIFEMAANLLFQATTKPEEHEQPKVLTYAVDFWVKHFVEIDLSKATDDEVVRVVEILHKIMSNYQDVSRIFESCGDTLYSEMLPASGTPWLQNIKEWALYANSSSSISLSPQVGQWAKEFIASEAPLMTLSRGHVLNWFSRPDGLHIYNAFRYSRDSFSASNIEVGRDSEETVLKIAEYFPGNKKTAGVMRAIGASLAEMGLAQEALGYVIKGLEMLKDEPNHHPALPFYLTRCLSFCHSILGKHDETIREIDEAIALLPLDWNTNKNLAEINQELHDEKARALSDLGRIDEAIQAYADCRTVSPQNTLDWWLMNEMIHLLFIGNQDPDGAKFLALLQGSSEKERTAWFDAVILYNLDSPREKLNQMALNNGEDGKAFLLQFYSEYMATLSPRDEKMACARAVVAATYRIVFGDEAKAKEMYKEILNHTLHNPQLRWQFDDAVCGVRRSLAEITFQEFYMCPDPDKKVALLEEMKDFAARNTETELSGSNISVMVALMCKIVGHAAEYQTTLQKTFESCIDGLTDSVGWNDATSFRLLAKALACVEGLERDALIAMSCQFYKVTDEPEAEEEKTAEKPAGGVLDIEPGKKEDMEENITVHTIDDAITTAAEPTERSNLEAANAQLAAEKHVKEQIHVTEMAISTATITGGVEKDKSTIIIQEASVKPSSTNQSLDSKGTSKTIDVSKNGTADKEETITKAAIPTTDSPAANDEFVNEETIPENPDEEIAVLGGLGCDGPCGRVWGRWEVPIYFCLICTNCDLCPTCYNKRIAQNMGEKNAYWRSYCGMNHRYAKGPIKGWKGVKGGCWRIETESVEKGNAVTILEEVNVHEWLRGLKEERWPRAWELFWRRLEGVRDIGF